MKYHALTLALVLNIFMSPTYAQDIDLNVPVLVLQTSPPEQNDSGPRFKDSKFASEHLSEHQEQLLLKAYTIAKEDGHKEPAILPAVVFQETKAGTVVGYLRKTIRRFTAAYREKCFGISQIKLGAARAVLKRYPELSNDSASISDSALVNKLIGDDDFNMRVASKYLLMMEDYGGKSLRWKVAAYNQGPGGAKGQNLSKLPYVKRVEKLVENFKSDTYISS